MGIVSIVWVTTQLAAASPAPTLTLQDAVSRGVARAAEVAVAEAEVDVASAEAAGVGLNRLPSVTLSASYTRIGYPELDRLTPAVSAEQAAALRAGVAAVEDPAARGVLGPLVEGQLAASGLRVDVPDARTAFELDVVWPVTSVFLRVAPALEAGEHAVEAARARADLARSEVAYRVGAVYLSLARAQALTRSAVAAQARAQGRLEEAQARVNAGAGLPVELAEWRAQIASAQASQARAEAGAAEAWAALAVWIGADGPAPQTVIPAADVDDHDPVRTADLVRGDRRALRAQARAAEAGEDAARGGLWPELALFAHVGVTDVLEGAVPPLDGFAAEWRAGVALRWSPDGAARADAAIDAARGQRRAAEEGLRALDEAIAIALDQAAARLSGARRVVAAASVARDAAQAVVTLRERQVAAGVALQSDLVAAELLLTVADVDVVEARIAQAEAVIARERALGVAPLSDTRR